MTIDGKKVSVSGPAKDVFVGTATDDPPSPADPGYGVYEFKKSFGPDFIRLAGYYDYILYKPLYSILIYAEKYILPFLHKGLVLYSKVFKK